MPFQKQHYGGVHDVQWHKSPKREDRAYFRAGSNWYNPVLRTRGREYQRKGRYVCKWGKTTGRTCGHVAGKEFDPGRGFDNRFIRVHNRNGKNLSSGGDSGGPWFDGNTAYGIHGGYTGNGKRDSYFMAINFVSDSWLGISHIQKR